jgi:hypothetical protein
VDDDDLPLTPSVVLNEKQVEVELGENPWSMDFAIGCSNLVWFGNPHCAYPVWLMKELSTAVFRTKKGKHEVTIKRQPSVHLRYLLGQKGCTVSPGIEFVVRAGCDRTYYLLFDDNAGALVVQVERIMAPDNDTYDEHRKWSETMSFRRVFDTGDAVMKAKGQKDRGEFLGEKALRNLYRREQDIAKERGEPYTTFHVGDNRYLGDIRTLVGVVRWKDECATDLEDGYFSEYRPADLVITGKGVNQNPSR